MSDKKSVSLRCQLLYTFGVSAFLPLATVLLACDVFLYFQARSVQNDANDSLFSTASKALSTINTAAATSFDNYLTYTSFTAVLLPAAFTGDIYRNDWPFNSSTLFAASPWSYFCEIFQTATVAATPNVCIGSQLVNDDRSGGGLISLASSAVSIPGVLYDGDAASFSAHRPVSAMAIAGSALLDVYNGEEYVRESAFETFLLGFQVDGLYRRYPAAPRNQSNGEAYDPRNRPWYLAVPSLNSGAPSVHFTAPYYNAFTGVPQTSVSSGVYNALSGQFEGVYGGDFILSDLANRLEQIQFQGGFCILFDKTSALVVARTNNSAAAANVAGVISYSQLTLPVISPELWGRISSVSSAATPLLLDTGDYLIRISLLYLNGSQSLLLSNFLPKAVLSAQIAPVSSAVSSDLREFTIAVNTAFGALIVVVIGVILYITDKLARPLEKVSNASTQLVKNIGSDHLADGVELAAMGHSLSRSANDGLGQRQQSDGGVLQVQETKQLQSQFVEMLHAIEENRREAARAAAVANIFRNPQQTPWFERLGPPPAYAPGSERSSKGKDNKEEKNKDDKEEKKTPTRTVTMATMVNATEVQIYAQPHSSADANLASGSAASSGRYSGKSSVSSRPIWIHHEETAIDGRTNASCAPPSQP